MTGRENKTERPRRRGASVQEKPTGAVDAATDDELMSGDAIDPGEEIRARSCGGYRPKRGNLRVRLSRSLLLFSLLLHR